VSVTWGGGKAPGRRVGPSRLFGRRAQSLSFQRLTSPAPAAALLPSPRTESRIEIAEPRTLIATG
jgi:hypothetical protein